MAISNDTVGLVFKLQADSAPAKQELAQFKGFVQSQIQTLQQDATSKFGAIGNAIGGLAGPATIATAAIAGIGIAAAATLTTLFQFAKEASDLGSKIHDLNQSTGLSTEALSGLRVVAEQSGSTLDTVGKAVEHLSHNLVQAQEGNKELRSIFKQLGVDLNGSVDDALRKIVKRFDEIPDGVHKTALAMKVFGKAGADLIPTLDALEGDLDKNIEKARELGLVFDKEAADAADTFGDSLDNLNRQMEGLKITIGNAVIPAFTGWIFVINETGKAIRNVLNLKEDFTSFLAQIAALGLIAQNPSLLANAGAALGGSNTPKTGDVNFPTKGSGKKEKDLKEFFTGDEDFKLLAKLQREAFDQEIELNKLREEAEKEHQKAMAEITLEGEQRRIERIRSAADERAITEEQAEEKIGAIRLAAFTRQEAQFAEELAGIRTRLEAVNDAIEEEGLSPERQSIRQELLTQEQFFVDQIRLLNEKRISTEEETVERIRQAREKDLQDLIQKTNQIKQIYEDLDKARKQSELSNPLSARSLFGDEFADTLRRTGSELAAFQALAGSVAASITSQMKSLKDVATDTFGTFAQGIGSMVEQYVLLGTTGPAALRKLLAATLAHLAAEAAVQAIYSLALGFVRLAQYDFAAAASAFTAAAIWGSVAGVAAIAGRAIAPKANAGGSVSQGQQSNGTQIIEQGGTLPGRSGPPVVIIHARQAPGVVVDLVTEDFKNNGQIRQVIRRDAEVGG